MRHIIRASLLCFIPFYITACFSVEHACDVCIYGGTSAGVIAARSIAAQGKSVVIVEPSGHLGGMTSGGLGQTDIGKRQALTGLAGEFYRDIGARYGAGEKLVFEPHVASVVFAGYLDNPHILVLKNHGLVKTSKRSLKIRNISISPLDDEWEFCGRIIKIRAKEYIDASYEGDLLAVSGVSYTTGRESSSVYGEFWNGRHFAKYHQFPDGIDPYIIPGDPSSGLVWGVSDGEESDPGTGDTLLQAYNIRVCLTDSTDNKIPITEPEGYDASRYEFLARLISAQDVNARYFIWSPMPGRKTDINNYGGFSTDMIGFNQEYLTAGYSGRKQIMDAHTAYTKGLFWFLMTDSRVPEHLASEISRWGYPKDEYPASGHWTPQLYIREGRRMISDYVLTQSDCEGRTTVPDGIAEAAYMMDSHNCRRIVVHRNGVAMVKNEGDVEIKIPGPYKIPYRSIIPKRKECTNLVVPVCVSASHIAYGSIRMEPVFMSLGEVAAIAACLAIDNNKPLQDINPAEIKRGILN